MIHLPELVKDQNNDPDLTCNNCDEKLVVDNYLPKDHGTIVEMLCPGCGALLSVRGQVRYEIVDE